MEQSKFFFFTLLITVLLFSCSSQKTPKEIIKKEEMVKILVDCYLAEALITSKNPYEKIKEDEFTQAFYMEIFEKHNITPQQFRESYTYYTMHLSEMKDIYENVINELNAK